MSTVGGILITVINLYIFVLIARFIVDWVQVFARDWTPKGPVLVLLEVIYSLTDPPIRAIRRVLPPIRLGAMALDLSPLIVLVVLILLRAVVAIIFV